MSDAETLDIIDAIYSTRAVRRLRPDDVPDEVIWNLLDAAIRGPSSGNSQRWAWIVIKDNSTKARIGEWYLEAWNSLGRSRRTRLRDAARRVLRRTPASGDGKSPDPNLAAGEHLARNLAKAPVLILAAMRGIEGEPTVVDGADLFPAVQNLMLAARKHGLGTTLTMLHRQHERDTAALLGLPADVRTLALIPVGYPESASAFTMPRRNPVETVTHWDRWGSHRSRSATTDSVQPLHR